MPNISYLIKMLQNEDHNKRYEACEELRVSKIPLPQEALNALAIAKNDKNPDVAEAALRALEFHRPNALEITPPPTNSETILPDANPAPKAVQDAQATHKIVSTVYVLLTSLILIMNCWGLMFGLAVVGWQAVIGLVLMPILIVGGCIYGSKYFINQGNTRLGYIILFSAPILAWLYLVKDTW